MEAVHIIGNCGATNSFTENIFIVPAGEKTPKPKDDYRIFLADHVDGLELEWREPKVLEIKYKEVRILNLQIPGNHRKWIISAMLLRFA